MLFCWVWLWHNLKWIKRYSYSTVYLPWTGRNVMENRQNVRWRFLMTIDSKKAIQLWFLISVSLLHLSSPSWARTNNPSVNSRMLYHWAIEEYRRNFFLTIVTIAQSFSKNNTFSKNNIKNHQISLMAFRYTFKTAYTLHLSFHFCEHNHSGQALDRLVTVSSMPYGTSTPALSTSSSSRGLTSFEWDISSWGGLHA